MPRVEYDKMTDAQLYVECADAVSHMAMQVMVIARQTAMVCRTIKTPDESTKLARPMLEYSMQPMMAGLGDMLNAMDAVEEGDQWIDPLFDELRRRFEAALDPHA